MGVTAGIQNVESLDDALDNVWCYVKKGKNFLAQEFIEGDDCRILVIGYKKCFCLQRSPACVVGDGKSTIEDLVDKGKIKTGSLPRFREVPKKSIEIALKVQKLNFKSILPKIFKPAFLFLE